jgi:hypothetical protein
VESSDGTQRIAPREIFEDVYVAMGPVVEKWPLLDRRNFSLSNPGVAHLYCATWHFNEERHLVEKGDGEGSIPLAKTEIQYVGIPS